MKPRLAQSATRVSIESGWRSSSDTEGGLDWDSGDMERGPRSAQHTAESTLWGP
jgi:hypothetical protein